MGQTSSSSSPVVQGVQNLPLTEAMRSELDEFFVRGVVVPQEVKGGSEAVVEGGYVLGGADVMQNYGDSVYAQNKEKMIRNIAEDVFTALKLKGASFAKSAPINDVVKHLAKVVPKSGKNFNDALNKSSSKQSSVCKVIANAVNKHYGSAMIDLSASAGAQCKQVAEVMHTLLVGLNNEFMAVAGDVLRTLRNMQLLNQYIDASYKKQQDIVNRSGDAGLQGESKNVKEFYDRLKSELERQMAMVSNMLSVSIGPTQKNLIALLEENKDFTGMVSELKADLGTSQFGDKLAYMLSGVSSVAHSADAIQKALKKLGMSVKDFKAAKNTTDLRLKVYDHIQKKNPSSKELDALMAAANVVYKHDYAHDRIADAIKGGMEASSVDAAVEGGADSDDDDDTQLPAYWSKKSLSKKIKKKEKYRKLLLKDFKKLLRGHYRNIVVAASGISSNIGGSIPVNDDLDKFINVFKNMQTINEENLHVALSGYAKDVTSRNRREEFMNNYQLVVLAAEPLAKGAGGAHFKKLQSAIRDVVKAVDTFSDKIVNALTEIHIERPAELAKAVRSTASDFFGSGEAEEHGGAGDVGSFVEFERVRNEMTYRYAISNIKSNLATVSAEMKSFSDDYEAVLGEEAGWLINQIRKEYNDLMEKSNPDYVAPANGAATAEGKALSDYKNAGNTDEAKNAYESLCYLWKMQRDAKIKMVEVAQAVDLYLKAFANGVARNPDSVKSVVKMLDQVEIVAKWFNDRSGDHLTAVFEAFPSGLENSDAHWSQNGSAPQTETKSPTLDNEGKVSLPDASGESKAANHYYGWLESKQGSLPGNPFIGHPMLNAKSKDRLKALKGQTEKTVKSMRALENILSAFKSVGSKFGDLSPQAHTFMNPGQIFNALCEYICASAYTSCYLPDSADKTSAVYKGLIDADLGQAHHHKSGKSTQELAKAANFSGSGVPAAPPLADVHGVLTGVSTAAADVKTKALKVSSVAMAGLPGTDGTSENTWAYHDLSNRDKTRTDRAGWRDHFYDTDQMFQMVVKSIVAKVLTIVDAYRLFHRPTTDRFNRDSLNPLRTILGGADVRKSHVKVIPEAVELYLRLPLLAEWYRDMFGFRLGRDDAKGDELGFSDPWKLSLVPNIDGVWSGLVNLLFDKVNYVSEGNYTEGAIQKMIEEMNKIYKSYKTRGKAGSSVRGMLNAFVIEMNRVFGFMKQEEINKYLNTRRDYLNEQTYGNTEDSKHFLNYDILDADDQFGRGTAPSDKFINVEYKKKKRKERNMVHLQKAILDLRRRMDVQFKRETADGKHLTYSFVDTLRNYKQELKNARGDKAQYDVVLRMLQGSNKLVNVSSDKLVMVHEAVVAPLTVLYNLTNVLTKLNNHLHGTSLKNLEDFKAGMGAAAADDEKLVAAYGDFLKAAYPHAKDDTRMGFAHAAVADKFSVVANPGGYLATDGSFNVVNIMRDTIGALLDVCANPSSLVECNVGTSGNINVNFAKVEELAVSLLARVKSNINKLRIEFNNADEILSQYEHKDFPGSTHWVEEHLVEILLKNRDRCGLDHAVSEHLRETIKRAAAQGDSLYNSFASHAYYASKPMNMPDAKVANDLSTFPFNVLPVKVDKEARSAPQTDLLQAMRADGLEAKESKDNSANVLVDAPLLAFYSKDTLNKWDLSHSGVKSLLFKFNEILRHYLRDGVEEGSLKVHTPLFEPFMNSSASREIIQGQAFPDVLGHDHPAGGAQASSNRSLKPPPPGTVLFASTALTMKALLNTMDMRLKKKRHIYESSAEIPVHMKDRMRSNLPHYSKMFDIVQRRADLLRKLLINTPLNEKVAAVADAKEDFAAGDAAYFDGKVQAKLFDDTGKSSAEMRDHMAGILNHLVELCISIKRCCDNVYKEMQDTAPYFMETSKDFLAEYKQRTGELPVMPASNVLLPYVAFQGKPEEWNEGDGAQHMLMFPSAANGSDVYKFNRASRLLLARSDVEPQMAHVPGAQVIFNKYAAASSKQSTISAPEYAATVKLVVGLSRTLNDGTYSRMFDQKSPVTDRAAYYTSTSVFDAMRCPQDDVKRFGVPKAGDATTGADGQAYLTFYNKILGLSGVDASVAPADLNTDDKKRAAVMKMSPYPYQFSAGLRVIYNLAENPNQVASLEQFASTISPPSEVKTDKRSKLRVYNILDLNIVPINVHAFMREVPFVNILNYSYTFDRMVHDFVVPAYLRNQVKAGLDEHNLMIGENAPCTTTREMMVKLLCHPYADLSGADQYYGLVASLFNGNDDLKLGRPRYLSDQLWHKALLTSSAGRYGTTHTQEAGPQAYEAQRNTTQMASGPLSNPGLKVYDASEKKWKNAHDGVASGANRMKYMAELGKARFDTKLVRNLTWLVQLQRVMRVLMVDHLSWLSTPVIKGLKIANPTVTEYEANDTFTKDDFNGQRYDLF